VTQVVFNSVFVIYYSYDKPHHERIEKRRQIPINANEEELRIIPAPGMHHLQVQHYPPTISATQVKLVCVTGPARL
jgi:hypothetical protein